MGMRLIFSLLKLLNLLIPKDKRRILYISKPDFSDNPRHLYEYYRMDEDSGKKRHAWLCFEKESVEILRSHGMDNVYHIKSLRGLYEYFRSKYLVTNSSTFWQIKSPFQIQFALWHGMPLKNILRMGSEPMSTSRPAYSVDMRIAASPRTKALIAASFNYDARKVEITGQPRSDALFQRVDALKKLWNLSANDYREIVVYMPTYRSGYKNVRDGKSLNGENFFRLDGFSLREFQDFLEKNNILFLLKLHPFEEKLLPNDIESERIKIVSNRLLLKRGVDLYNLLADSTMLVTDYSSVYFDYLLLDRRMIFVPGDLQEYTEKRGFSLEPYDFWTPGEKVYSQESLQTAITDSDRYAKERATVREIIHTYRDDRSCRRLDDLIRTKYRVFDPMGA